MGLSSRAEEEGVGKGGVWVYEAYEVKNKREKLRCLLLRRKKKNIIYIFMKLMKRKKRKTLHYSLLGDRVTRLHPPAIIGLCSDTHECVEGSLTAHFLEGIPDVGVDENSRVVGVLGLPRQATMTTPFTGLFIDASCNPRFSHG
jgi:hypothetical protein